MLLNDMLEESKRQGLIPGEEEGAVTIEEGSSIAKDRRSSDLDEIE